METKVKVRVQANGGKYLGPAVASPHTPTLTVTVNGTRQPTVPFPICGSGMVCYKSSEGASPNLIVVTGDPAPPYKADPYYLLPSSDPATDPALILTLDLIEDQLNEVNFSVTAYSPNEVTESITEKLIAGRNYTDDPGFVVVVPGLRLTNIAVLPVGTSTVVTANVAMMCGCAITPDHLPKVLWPKEPYWPAYEFEVYAQIGESEKFRLACTGTSLFQGALPVKWVPGQLVRVWAKQPAMPGNENEVALTAFPTGGA